MVDEFGSMHEKVMSSVPSLRKGELVVNFPMAIAEFENAMHKFPVKKILYRSTFQGKGLEFDSYRLHMEGDDADMIDWKASLRANVMMARKYIEERDLNVYFLVDVSNSMLFGSGDKLKAEYAAEFVISLSHLVVGAGDRIGLVMFNDGVVKMLHASSNKNQFALFAKFLSDSSLYGGGFDLDRAIEHVLRRITSAYTVFILVSDFIGVRKCNSRSFRLMGSKFETLAVMVRDKFDENLPNTGQQFSIQDPYSGRQMILDPSIATRVYRESVLRQKGVIKEMFKHSRIDLVELMTDKGFTIPISGFLKGRALGGRV